MRTRSRRSSTSDQRYAFVRFQQMSARVALAEGNLESARASLRLMEVSDFDPPDNAADCLAVVHDPAAAADVVERAVRTLTSLTARNGLVARAAG